MATAVVSDPPRPRVVTLPCISYSPSSLRSEAEVPWKPATSTTFPESSSFSIRSVRTSMMRALVCEVSVTIPAWDPVRDSAS